MEVRASGRDDGIVQRKHSLGGQPRRGFAFCLPIASGLSCTEHFAAVFSALSVNDHPLRPREIPLRPHWAVAIEKQLSFYQSAERTGHTFRGQTCSGDSDLPLPCRRLIQWRGLQLSRIRLWAKRLEPQRRALKDQLHPDVQIVLGKVHVPLFEKLLVESGFPNQGLINDLTRGRPLVGTPAPGGALLPRVRPAEFSKEELEASDFSNLNARAIRAVERGSGDPDLDQLSYAKTMKDFSRGAIAGPFSNVADLLAALAATGDVEVTLSQILISPQHPVREKGDKVRNITNAKGTCNRFAGLSESYIPDGIEGLAAICQAYAAAAEHYPLLREEFYGFPSDYEGAYRQCPIDPTHFRFACTVYYNPDTCAPEFGFFRANPFGSNLAPNNWSEICFAMSWIGAYMLALATPTTVDDTSNAELRFTAQSAFDAWSELNSLTGWRIDDAKTPPPSREFRSVGVWVSLPFLRMGEGFTVSLLEERASNLQIGLEEVLHAGKLSPAQAAKWRGRLYFATSVGWYGAARAALGALKDRQYESEHLAALPKLKNAERPLYLCHSLTPHLRVAIRFLISLLQSKKFAEPRGFPSVHAPIRISYSDGEGSGGIGGILLPKLWRSCDGMLHFEQGVQPLFFSGFLPRLVPGQFGSESVSLEHITAIESAAVVVLLETFPELEDCLWIHFIDNESALHSFVKGSSNSLAMNELAAHVHQCCAARKLYFYVQRVESKSNPADPPSRGEELPRDPLGRGWLRREMCFPPAWQPR